MRARLLRAALGVALVGMVAGFDLAGARAGDSSDGEDSVLSKLMQTLGVKKSPDTMSDINYSERSPLVVPPTRDLPPPTPGLPTTADWPTDPGTPSHKRIKAKPAAASPAPTAAANGTAPAAGNPPATGSLPASGNPPASANPADGNAAGGQPNAAAPAGQPSETARVPNPVVTPKSVWNPKTWFNSEEYATFTTEPARDQLTDPPAGYRTPSPSQPYGVGPERKGKAQATNENQSHSPVAPGQTIGR